MMKTSWDDLGRKSFPRPLRENGKKELLRLLPRRLVLEGAEDLLRQQEPHDQADARGDLDPRGLLAAAELERRQHDEDQQAQEDGDVENRVDDLAILRYQTAEHDLPHTGPTRWGRNLSQKATLIATPGPGAGFLTPSRYQSKIVSLSDIDSMPMLKRTIVYIGRLFNN